MRFLLFALLFISHSAFAANVVNLTPSTEVSAEPSAAANISLGSDSLRGVKAEAYLQPFVADQPAEGEVAPNYRLQVDFFSLNKGEKILAGQAAARVFDAGSRERSTVRMEVEQEHWSCALKLPSGGESMIKVGTQLADGKKRIYRFFFNPEKTVPASSLN